MKNLTKSALQDHNINFGEGPIVDYHTIDSDYSHLLVSRFLANGGREPIGQVYTQFEGDVQLFISTDQMGKEIFPPTNDFSEVNRRFERRAKRIAIDKGPTYEDLKKNNYSLNQILNPMKTNQTPAEQKQKKINQIIFKEYDRPAKGMSFIEIHDSYNNTLGEIHRAYNEVAGKYEYTSFDHAGNKMNTSERVWELKAEFTKNREQLLEQAYQRRIAAKEKAKETPEHISQASKADERKNETEKLRQSGKSQERHIDKSSSAGKQNDSRNGRREEELENLRDNYDDDRGEMEM